MVTMKNGESVLHADAKLKMLANRAANAQVREHNNANAPSADKAIKAFEDYAKELGYTTTWPGLYPLITHGNGQQFTIGE